MPFVTWNPLDKSALMQLRAGNRSAFENIVNPRVGVRATHQKDTLGYCEFHMTSVQTADVYVGFCGISADLTDHTHSDNHTSWRDIGTLRNINGGITSTSYATGDFLGCAWKRNGGNIDYWWYKNGTLLSGTGDPATFTAPSATSSAAVDDNYPFYISDNITADLCEVKLVCNASEFRGVVPAGYESSGSEDTVDIFRSPLILRHAPRRNPLDWIQGMPLALQTAAPAAMPFSQGDWQNPRNRQLLADWIQGMPQALRSAAMTPFFQTDWPNPRRRQAYIDWIRKTEFALFAAPPVAVFPDPSDVREGVTYGPTGADFVGTFVCAGNGGSYLRRR